ncbi:MAG: hypothetical protein AAB478_02295 [Patescibacteria group bacterium]
MLPEYFIFIGTGINAIGAISYLIDTVRGRVQPNRVTWFLWALAPLVTVAAQLDQGVGLPALLTFSVGFLPALIVIASFFNKKAVWKITRFDIFCGVLSLVGLILWQITKVGNIAILLSIVADLFAGIPTFRKAYSHPDSESFRAFFLGAIGAVLVILTITTWTFAVAAFSVYFFLSNSLIAFLVKSRIGARSRHQIQ